MNLFTGKVVLITGASSGIGAALAREFVREGAKVVLAARRKERLDELAAELGANAFPLECDVCKDGDPELAVATAVAQFGRLDVVLANAGIGITGNVAELELNDFRQVFETNVFGVLRTIRTALPELKKTQGRLGITGSVNGFLSLPGSSAYCMSKFAVRALAMSLRHELHGSGVSITHIAPGLVASEIRLKDKFGTLPPGARDFAPPSLLMPAAIAARKIVRAVAGRRKELVLTGHGKLLVLLARHFPRFTDWLVGKLPRRPAPGKAS